jgi:methylated-DNA-[protein]-cysteine S-methyltransferase
MLLTHGFESPLGPLALTEVDGVLRRLDFTSAPSDTTTPLLREAERQLRAYFAGELRQFDLPLDPQGTPFQQQVWAALREIPYGEVRSYGQIAAAIGNPKACRAVGMANHRNPLPILIPCHRVCGSDGSLTGYGGGIERKKWLLELELGVRRDRL